jgi:hypothetical protein
MPTHHCVVRPNIASVVNVVTWSLRATNGPALRFAEGSAAISPYLTREIAQPALSSVEGVTSFLHNDTVCNAFAIVGMA